MFFSDHTTPHEQRTGFVSHDALLDRYISGKAGYLREDGLGYTEPAVSIAVGENVYELTIDLSPTPNETFPDELSWVEWSTVDRQLHSSTGCSGGFDSDVVPLTWTGMVESLCSAFELDAEVVWGTGVDLKAYWASGAPGNQALPLPEEAAKYALRALHGAECPYPETSPVSDRSAV